MKILVNPCITWVDRIGMRVSKKSWAVRQKERGRQAVSKFRKAVSMNITV